MTARSRDERPVRRASLTPRNAEPSLVEAAEANPSAAREMAAARLALSVHNALLTALHRSKLDRTALADRLGLSLSAVCQVLDGDGNIRVSTIGRYARALGYQASLRLDPATPQSPALDLPAPANLATTPAQRVFSVHVTAGNVWAGETEALEISDSRIVLRSEWTSMRAQVQQIPMGTQANASSDSGVPA